MVPQPPYRLRPDDRPQSTHLQPNWRVRVNWAISRHADLQRLLDDDLAIDDRDRRDGIPETSNGQTGTRLLFSRLRDSVRCPMAGSPTPEKDGNREALESIARMDAWAPLRVATAASERHVEHANEASREALQLLIQAVEDRDVAKLHTSGEVAERGVVDARLSALSDLADSSVADAARESLRGLWNVLPPDEAARLQHTVDNCKSVLVSSAIWSASADPGDLETHGVSFVDSACAALDQLVEAAEDRESELEYQKTLLSRTRRLLVGE